jgi:transposase InsO family protein
VKPSIDPCPATPAASVPAGHLDRLAEFARLQAQPPPARRGSAWQQPRRQLEQTVRHEAVVFAQDEQQHGRSLPEAAARLRVAPRTLRAWRAADLAALTTPSPLGRPVLRADRLDRNAVLAMLEEAGPGLGLPSLCEAFPDLRRAELGDLLGRYRRCWRHRGQPLHVLHWHRPGVVWAMDFAESPAPVDGLEPYLLAVRDLASGYQLAWLPLRDMTAELLRPVLAGLFALFGAPLVLKSDNGSAFRSAWLLELLEQEKVVPLFSPPSRPSYNGACEAGIGSLKARTERRATTAGRPGQWTWDDAAAAVDEANETARPRGPAEPPPAAAWAQRRPVPAEERALFASALSGQRLAARAQEGLTPEAQLSEREEAQLERQALSRALVECDYLSFTRRRIPRPIPPRKTANIP